MQLKDLRKKIDIIDKKILSLLNQRAEEVIRVNKLKKRDNLEIFSSERESLILDRLKKTNKGPLLSEDIDLIFKEVLSVCRSLRKGLRIVYLGPEGTFTHLAAIRKFGKKPQYIPAESINEIFEKVEREEAEYGVVPIENSIEGVVNYTLDMFLASNLKICSEISMNISHSLLGTSSKSLKRIYSNPQVFAQCRKWIGRNMPNIDLVATASTAKAALAVKKDSQGACIGNKILANIYGLRVIASSIEDFSSNITRFLVIARNDSSASGRDKTSILFSIKDKVGALHDSLAAFKRCGINLTKIESRPSKKKAWDYYFFVDFQGHRSLPAVQKVLKSLEKRCTFVKILGSYPRES
ncbi:MAG: prephenate dehydratase [Candidatus Omnitrophota bacterium]|nr:MAG: prephenate dehydratase [Candidatus Omnitrophota bacterium]